MDTGTTTGFQEIFDASGNLVSDTPVSEFVFHPAHTGVYYLVSSSNPDGNFLETTTANNTAWTSFRLTRDSKATRRSEISHSACSGTLCGEDIPNR